MNTLCPFCDPAQKYRQLTETKLVQAMYAKSPACKYHVLLMPKRHVRFFDDMTKAEEIELYSLLQYIVRQARKKLPDFIGYNLLSNNGGPQVRQRVPHCHVHLFLRSSDDKQDPLATTHATKPPALTKQELPIVKLLQEILD